MPSRNTNTARHKGYSDMSRMLKDSPKSPALKNYGVKTGKAANTARIGKNPANPPTANNAHWSKSKWEEKRRKGQL